MEQSIVVPFYYDPISPYVWLASRQLPRLQQAGIVLDCQPVLFAGLLNAHGQKGPAEIAAKRVYTFADVLRQATRLGLPFQGPPGHPFNSLRALRICLALPEPEERLRLACQLVQACWERGANLSDPVHLSLLLAEAGLQERDLLAASETPAIKQQLLDNTNAAIDAGIFGVPSFVLNGELFWGSDRIDDLLWRLQHPERQDLLLQDFLQRPPLAQRRQG